MSHSRSGRGTQSLRQSSPGVGSSGCLPMILSGFKMVRLRHTTDLLTLAIFGTPILNCRLLTYMIGPVSASEVESNPVSTADSSTFWHTADPCPNRYSISTTRHCSSFTRVFLVGFHGPRRDLQSGFQRQSEPPLGNS